jgi:hypothetical protein
MNELVAVAGGPNALAVILAIAVAGALLVAFASLAVTVRAQR